MVFSTEVKHAIPSVNLYYDYEVRGDSLLTSMPKAAKQSGFQPLKNQLISSDQKQYLLCLG